MVLIRKTGVINKELIGYKHFAVRSYFPVCFDAFDGRGSIGCGVVDNRLGFCTSEVVSWVPAAVVVAVDDEADTVVAGENVEEADLALVGDFEKDLIVVVKEFYEVGRLFRTDIDVDNGKLVGGSGFDGLGDESGAVVLDANEGGRAKVELVELGWFGSCGLLDGSGALAACALSFWGVKEFGIEGFGNLNGLEQGIPGEVFRRKVNAG